MPTPVSQIFHIYSRLGFGIVYSEAKLLSQKSLTDLINNIIDSSSAASYLTDIKKEDIPSKKEAMEEGMNKKELQNLIQEKLQELNISWIKKLLTSKNILAEKQTLFWHNHFACRIRDPFAMQELNNIHQPLEENNRPYSPINKHYPKDDLIRC